MEQHPSQPPPPPEWEEVLFTSLANLVREYIAKRSEYGGLAARQFAIKAGHHARDWYPALRGDDEPLPAWMRDP